MGQYHKVVNLDKKQVINPHNMGCGIKLLEFSESRVTTALSVLLACSNNRGGGDLHSDSPMCGSWAGDRIAIIGDYWEEDEAKETGIPTWEQMDEEAYDNEGNRIPDHKGEYTDISMDILKVLCEDKWFKDELLESLARYDWGRDWSSIFTKAELKKAKADYRNKQ